MGQTIQFINNTTDTIAIQGIDASAFASGSYLGSLTCVDGNCLIAPGKGSASIGDLSTFQLNGGADFAFAAGLATPASINPSPFGGIKQGNYSATIALNGDAYTVVIIDTTIEAQTIQFVNNTKDTITIKGIALPLDAGAFIAPITNLSFGSGIYTLTAPSGTATIGDLSIYDSFQIGSTDFAFDVILGLKSIIADMNAPPNQSSYMGSIIQDANQYTIIIDPVPNAKSMIVINNTQDSILVQGIDISAFDTVSFQGAFTSSDGSCSIAPGTGSAGMADAILFESGFQLNGGADFAFDVALGGDSSAVTPSPYGGANQSGFAAGLQVNGTQYIITISPTPANPTIQFVNNTSDTITLDKTLDSGALTNCFAGLNWNGTNYLQTTGVGTGEIGDIPSTFTLTINGLTFTVTLGASPTILPPLQSNYEAVIGVLGNLYTITIQIDHITPGPGTKVNFTFTGGLTELLFSGAVPAAYFSPPYNYEKMLRESTSVKAIFTTTATGIATMQTVSSVGTLNPSSINNLKLDSSKSSYQKQPLSGDVMIQFNTDDSGDPPVVTLYSQNVVAGDVPVTPQPFLFPLNLTGTSTSVELVGPGGVYPINITSNDIELEAHYGPFNIPKYTLADVPSYNTGIVSSSGFTFVFVLPISGFDTTPTSLNGSIVITDTTQADQEITFNIASAPNSFDPTGKAHLIVTGNFYGIDFVISSAIADLYGDQANNYPMITISGLLNRSVKTFYYNNSITGVVNLTFNN